MKIALDMQNISEIQVSYLRAVTVIFSNHKGTINVLVPVK